MVASTFGGTAKVGAIIVANSTGGDCFVASPFTDLGYNLDDDGSCGLSSASPYFDVPNVSETATPVLDPAGLEDNGGATKTIALIPGSPALGASQLCASPYPAQDQRGVARPATNCDIGAFQTQPLALTPSSLPNPVVGVPYNVTIVLCGGVGPFSVQSATFTSSTNPPVTFSLSSTQALTDLFDHGLTMVATQGTPNTLVTISGTPTVEGDIFSLTLPVEDADGFTASQSYSETVVPDITLSPPTLANPIWESPYSVPLSAGGGVSPYTYALTAGSLPTGLSVNPTTGVLGGTSTDKTQIGHTFSFTVTATDKDNFTGSQRYSITLGSPCATALTPYFLSATYATGTFTGVFCVNAYGDGTYTQYSPGLPVTQRTLTGTGHIRVNSRVISIQAYLPTFKNLNPVGTTNGTASSFSESGSGFPHLSGTFTLT